ASERPRRRSRGRWRPAGSRRAASTGPDPSGRSVVALLSPGLRRGKSPWPSRSWRAIAPGWSPSERRAEPRILAERPLDPQELVVFGRPLTARWSPGLHLPRVRRDGQIGDRGVFGLSAPVRDDDAEAGALCRLDRVERLREGPDLVHLDQDRVRRAGPDPSLEPFGVRDEQIVTHHLNPSAERSRERGPPFPIVLRERILERDDREPIEQVRPEGGHVVRRPVGALEVIASVLVELGGRRIER